jgi:cell division protein FtsI/penicillin-binding protein 2
VETGLDTAAIGDALEGLRGSVNDPRGTGHHLTFEVMGAGGPEQAREPIFNARGVSVWGKTGTADAPALVADPDGEGPEAPRVLRDGDHSWFVVLAGPEGGRPLYSIAVMMEYAGSGGKVSGPIANQVVHALVAEGYLPGGGASTADGADRGRGGR